MSSQTNHGRPTSCRTRPTPRSYLLTFLTAVIAGALSFTTGCEVDLETCVEQHGECMAECLDGDRPCLAECYERYELCVEVVYLAPPETTDWGED